ncbi:MAG: HD domain-containing protein [Acidimicrobiia bacterium]
MAGPLHLARRFLGSLSPRPLDPADDAWARAHLLPGEQDLWRRMSRADRKHAAGVARDVDRRLGPGTARPVIAAALLHDVGKVDAGLGTFGRVAATLVGRRRATGSGRVARYLRHDAIGARLLADAGADPLTVAWAREHHRPESDWSVPRLVGRALRDADDD